MSDDELDVEVECDANLKSVPDPVPPFTETYEETVQKVRTIVRFFRNSTVRNHSLKEDLKRRNKEPLSMVIDMPVRWNTTYDMLQRFLVNMESAHAVVTEYGKEEMCLNTDQVQLVRDMAEALQLFKELTTLLS